MAEVAIGLSASGLLYLLPYFFAAPSSDFRYLYWSIVAANLSTVIVGGILIQITVELLRSRETQARKEAVLEAG
jgi:VIT1/CCC1 family predicted Fe2+/Mn2+ transporter